VFGILGVVVDESARLLFPLQLGNLLTADNSLPDTQPNTAALGTSRLSTAL